MFLTQLSEELPKKVMSDAPWWWWVGLFAIVAILSIPWIWLLIYSLTVKYRVRVYSNGFLIIDKKLKAKTPLSELELPKRDGYIIEGIYRDPTFMLPLEDEVMPRKNLKLYIRWQQK